MGQSNGNSVQSVDRIGIRAVKTVFIDFREAKTILGMEPVLFVLRLGKMHFFLFVYILLMPSHFVGVRLKVIEKLIFHKSLLK